MPASPDPFGKRALFWAGRNPGEQPAEDAGRRSLFSAPPKPDRGSLVLSCSSCGARTVVGWVEFARRHFPFWLWVPWKPTSRLIECPACRRRTWLEVSLRRS